MWLAMRGFSRNGYALKLSVFAVIACGLERIWH
jgi:hypothetical protein